ncbi:hypothetical protein [Streptomyces sp. MUM 136J]|uniref:hypothetical protein n=1 Tax=Streptomyces sp. MUM 136J TaxID=2791992 RepID=UPI0035AB96CB
MPFSREDWRIQFRDAWPGLAEACCRYDPRHLLTPGQGVFQPADRGGAGRWTRWTPGSTGSTGRPRRQEQTLPSCGTAPFSR